jgi:catechol 2,3-dioxygenase-like lactoylglutathione lyase family enzyme
MQLARETQLLAPVRICLIVKSHNTKKRVHGTSEMTGKILGIHHVTAISSDPQQTINFYTETLGLHMVKLTVNYDDSSTYHVYFGDEIGRPGTILTFFPWPEAPRGRRGTGQLTVISFAVPEKALDYWVERFKSHKVQFQSIIERFGQKVLPFTDADGQNLELVATTGYDGQPWKNGGVPVDHAIRGFHSVTLLEEALEGTESLLLDILGFRQANHSENRFRYEVGKGGSGTLVDVLAMPREPRGFVSVGTVHHVAFRVSNDDEQKVLREEILKVNRNVTPVINRNYFRSIYFREPGGVLFEAATDPPGFTIDEPVERLGTSLALPQWLEPQRDRIAIALPKVRLPKLASAS